MAVIERHRPAKEPPAQLPLFELMEGRYEVVVTNLHLSAENIWRLYNRGTVVEQVSVCRRGSQRGGEQGLSERKERT